MTSSGIGKKVGWRYTLLLAGSNRASLSAGLDATMSAARTTQIRLGVAVLNLPFLSPAYLAKQASTLDVLSGGRADIGLGTGWSHVEFAATGSDPHPRGRRTEEYLAVLRTLFTDKIDEALARLRDTVA